MLTIYQCLVQDHDLRYVFIAAAVCLMGCYLTMRLFARSLSASGRSEKLVWNCLAGLVGGGVIWTTHFLSMLGYAPGYASGYAIDLTIISLGIAIASCVFGFAVASFSNKTLLAEGGGLIVGLGIGGMHYTGMSAFNVPGTLEWNSTFVWVSLLLGAVFAIVATNRVIRPLTRYCRHGGTVAFILAIVSTHFTGMSAVSITLDPSAALSSFAAPSSVLGISVLGVMLVLLALAACTYVLDAHTTQAAIERYRHLSLHDPLTGLPNRAAFQEEQRELVKSSFLNSGKVAVLSFDLNRFKEINDVHGHAAGDAVLQAIGGRISSIVGAGEFLARIGGDEFIAFSRSYFGRNDGLSLAHRILAEIARPIEWSGNRFLVSSSVGIAAWDKQNGEALENVIAQADVAMYRAKATGPNAVCFYEASMDEASRQRNALAIDLRRALSDDELEIYYQVQHDTQSGELIGFEALLRWNHPLQGRISPAEFIPIAERSGLIIEIGEWVLNHACREASQWKNPYSVAVNVAAQQLSDVSFPSKVKAILQRTGLAPQRLELEITESGLIKEQERALVTIRQLKELGVKIAMDDYGTGYSSLSTLMSFPFDKIKIDRSFIDKVHADKLSAAIVRSTLILAHSLNIPVLAEGVETEEHVAFLRSEGCEQLQGYYFGRPVPLAEIDGFVNGMSSTTASEVSASSNSLRDVA